MISNKQLITSIFFLWVFAVMCGQESLTTTQWQEDLRYLQKEVHTTYPFLFKKVKRETWDAVVETLYTDIPTLEEHQIKVGLTRMVSMFGYGHTQIPFGTIAQEVLAVNLYHFDDGIFVEGVQKGDEKALGAQLLSIEGVPVKEALAAIRPVVPAENDMYFKGYGLRFLTVPTILHAQGITADLKTTITMTLEKDGKVFDYTFKAIPREEMSRDYGFTTPNERWVSSRDQQETPLYIKHLHDRRYFFEYLPATKTVYVRQSSVFSDEKETLQEFYKRLFAFVDGHQVDKFIYDVRLNGGGDNTNNKPLIQAIMARPKINTKGSFFYIIGRNTFSAAQNLTNEIEYYTQATIVGEPTSENLNFYGDARRVTLPNSRINAYLSYVWWQDRPQGKSTAATVPDMAAAMTAAQYFSNRDVVLDAALDYTAGDFVHNPMEYLTELYTKGNYDQVRTEAKKIAQDTRYRYYDFQQEFGTIGYQQFMFGNTEKALFLLGVVADAYPESVAALYSLAGVQEQVDLVSEALDNYIKIIALEPESAIGKAAQKRVEALKK